MAELVDAQRSERCELQARGGSNPLFGTFCGRGGTGRRAALRGLYP